MFDLVVFLIIWGCCLVIDEPVTKDSILFSELNLPKAFMLKYVQFVSSQSSVPQVQKTVGNGMAILYLWF